MSDLIRDLNTLDRGTPIETHWNGRWHRWNPVVHTRSLLLRVRPPLLRSSSLWATTPTSSASTMFTGAHSVI
jgi:hypothetical protein